MFLGKQAARAGLCLSENCEILYIIHPTVSPPDEMQNLPCRVVIAFPEIDEIGNRAAWEQWAEKQGAKFIISKGSGVDIRAVWPEVLSEAFEEGEER